MLLRFLLTRISMRHLRKSRDSFISQNDLSQKHPLSSRRVTLGSHDEGWSLDDVLSKKNDWE